MNLTEVMISIDKLNKQELTPFGRMNRANRIYFKQTLRYQAEALNLTPAKLSAYEIGKLIPRDDLVLEIYLYWATMFKSVFPVDGGEIRLFNAVEKSDE